MKKHIIITVFAATAALLMASCTKQNPAVKIDFSVSEKAIIEPEGGSAVISVASLSTWTATTDASWLKLSSTGGKNCGTIEVSAAANTSSLKARTATVTVVCDGVSKTTTVIQNYGQAAALALAKGQASRISFAGQNIKLALTVTSNVKYGITTSDSTRIKVNDDKKGNVTVSVDTNDTEALREFYVAFNSDIKVGEVKDPKDSTKTIPVYQADTLKFVQEFEQYFEIVSVKMEENNKTIGDHPYDSTNVFSAQGGKIVVRVKGLHLNGARIYSEALRYSYTFFDFAKGFDNDIEFDVPANTSSSNLDFDIKLVSNMTDLNVKEHQDTTKKTFPVAKDYTINFKQIFDEEIALNISNEAEKIDVDFIGFDGKKADVPALSNKGGEYFIVIKKEGADVSFKIDGAELAATEAPNIYKMTVAANSKEKVQEIELKVITNINRWNATTKKFKAYTDSYVFKQAAADPKPTK